MVKISAKSKILFLDMAIITVGVWVLSTVLVAVVFLIEGAHFNAVWISRGLRLSLFFTCVAAPLFSALHWRKNSR
ncbi:MAG: hypothetical protein JKY60_07635 [Kordiimonadaceae bacterium]|nr:hypothetical protein [Kordiimonadaceae bacterium]